MGFLWDFYKRNLWEAQKKPPLSGEVARRNAGTERLQQICDNLSVSLRLTAPLEGEPWVLLDFSAGGGYDVG